MTDIRLFNNKSRNTVNFANWNEFELVKIDIFLNFSSLKYIYLYKTDKYNNNDDVDDENNNNFFSTCKLWKFLIPLHWPRISTCNCNKNCIMTINLLSTFTCLMSKKNLCFPGQL